MPDQGLNVLRNDEVLLRFSQHKRQIRERTSQVSAAACRQARTEHVGHVPGLPSAHRHFSGEVMRAHIKRIIEKNLSSRRLVVCVIQPHERVSQEGNNQAAGVHQFLMRIG